MPALTPMERETIQAVLDRANKDIHFREALLKDPQSLLTSKESESAKAFAQTQEMSSDALTLLFSMRRVALEEAGLSVKGARSFLRDNGHSSSRAE